MAIVLKDRVKVLATTTGTGTFTLGSAVTGYQSFSVIGDGNSTYYTIAAQATADWEVGIGTYTASGTLLSRDTILESSNGGAAVDFPAGVKDVFVTYPAERSVYLDSAGSYPVQNTFNTLNATTAVLTAGTISTTPASGTDIVNKTYVDTVASSGIHFHTPVRVESPTALTVTYNNGTAGVGATLTNAGTQVALVLDGITLSVSDRVLIYTQADATQNGVYVVTNVGSGSTNWVLTRASDADTYGVTGPTTLSEGSTFFVTSGNTGAGETYTCNTIGTITFGTTNITFAQISSAQIYSAGTGLTLTNTTFSITNTGTAGTYGSASNVPVFVTNAQGQVTSVTNTAIAIAAGAVSGLAASATTDTTNASNITSGTLGTGRISGSYTGITGVGILTAGTWNGSTIAANYGGTGYSSYTVGDLLYSDTSSTLAKLADVAVGNALISGGVAAAPSWGKIGLATHVDGTLPVANGGSGATTLTGYLKGNGTSAFTATSTIPSTDITGLGTMSTQNANSVAVTGGTINGTTIGGTTPAAGTFTSLTDSGNLTFTGTGNRITGDFSNATLSNRVSFQSSTTNGSTWQQLIPNGTSNTAGFLAFNGSDPENSAFGGMFVSSSNFQITTGQSGTGINRVMLFSVAGSERVRIDTSGNVGIGQSSPTFRLDVARVSNLPSNVYAGGTDFIRLLAASGSAFGEPAIKFQESGADIGAVIATKNIANGAMNIIFANRDVSSLTSTMTERMIINTNGDVGIGTSSPTSKLHVVGGRTDLSANNEPYSLGVRYNSSTGHYYIGATNSASPDMVFSKAGGVESMRLTDSGNLGIGTSSPARRVDSRSTSSDYQYRAGDSANPALSYDFGRENVAGLFRFYGNQTGATGYIFDGVDGERMRIDSSGNVGIGTSSPLGKLKIAVGNVAPAASGNMNTGVIFETGATGHALNMGVDGTAGYSWINAAFANNSGVANNLVLMTGAAERMRIHASGGVSIGNTTDPGAANLSVTGTISGGTVTGTVDGTNAIGFRTIPQNSQSAAYTLVLTDSGKQIFHPSADTTARTFTIPANGSVAYPIGTAVTFINQNGAGVITIAITTDTMRLAGAGTTGSRTLAANGIATAIKVTSTEWIISGTGLT
jgi:hypothetical protein